MKRLHLLSTLLGWAFITCAVFLGLRPQGPIRRVVNDWTNSSHASRSVRDNWESLSQGEGILGGNTTSPTAVEFIDYRCAYCRQLHDSLSVFLANATNMGITVRYLVRRGSPSHFAAAAALCAARDDRFQEMHAFLLSDTTWVASSDWRRAAEATGVRDVERWEECIVSGEIEEILTADSKWAEDLNIDNTPTLVTKDGKAYQGGAAIAAWMESASDPGF